MTDDERLREALVELERLRAREARALAESNALLDGLERLSRADPPSEACAALLGAVRRHLGADAAVLARAGPGGAARIERALPAEAAGADWAGLAPLLAKPRRIPDLAVAARWRLGMPRPLSGHRALVSAPVPGEGDTAALICLSLAPGRFGAGEHALLQRMAGLAAQALAAEALAERNALLAAVIEGSAASVAIADAREKERPLVYVNPAFERLTGYPAAEVLGRNCRFLTDESPDSPERARLREAVAAGRYGRFELRNRRRDGTRFWNQLSLYPALDGEGAPRFLIATQVDISERRAIEIERDAARARMIEALSGASQGIMLIDSAGRLVFANESCREAFGAPGLAWEEGAPFEAIWRARLEALGASPEEARAGAAARLEALRAGAAEHEERLADGRILLVADRPTREGGAVSTITDVTSLKATEELLAQRAAAIDAAQDGIAVTDPSGRFVYMNPSHLAMFGFRGEEEALGRPWSDLYAPEESRAIERDAFPELARAGAWRGEATGRRLDGRPVEQEVSLTLLESGGIVCVTRDVSERRAAERERMRLRDQLQVAQRQEAVGQLAAGIAHDFNNLLSAISGSAALLAHDLSEGSGARAHADRITAAAGRASELIARLLDLGTRRSERRRIDLRETLASAAELLGASIPRQVRLSLELPEEPLLAEADPTEVLQVVLNLAINARDAIGAAPGAITLVLRRALPEDLARKPRIGRVEGAGPHLLLAVHDTGAGMAPEEAERIFAPYYTTKGDAGTGLGLSVVASILSENGAELSLDTAPGAGARFSILWPMEPARPPREASGQAAEGDPARLGGAMVLVAEDSEPVLGVLSEILARAGAEVGGCADPRDALAALEEDPASWDLLVTDFDMPGLTGAELARAARRAAPGLAVLLCTALPDWRGRDAAAAELFDAVTAKPVREAALLSAAARAIARRQSREDLPCVS